MIKNDKHNLTDQYVNNENFRHRIDAAEMLPNFQEKMMKPEQTLN
jgi:hypothetical protein